MKRRLRRMQLKLSADLTPAELKQLKDDLRRHPVMYAGLIKREPVPAKSPSPQKPTGAAPQSTTPSSETTEDDNP